MLDNSHQPRNMHSHKHRPLATLPRDTSRPSPIQSLQTADSRRARLLWNVARIVQAETTAGLLLNHALGAMIAATQSSSQAPEFPESGLLQRVRYKPLSR